MSYGRRSTDKQSDLSTVGQVELCRKLIRECGYEDRGSRSDEGKSGQTLFHRPGLRELVQLAREGHYKVLVMESLDRLSRNQADTHRLFEDLTRLGVVLHTVQEGVLTDLHVTIFGFKAAQDLKQGRQRIRRGQTEVLRDLRICGSISYGYKKLFSPDGVNGLREKHSIHAPVVLSIFQDFADGVSALAICKRLNDAGIPAARGGMWTPGVLWGSKDFGSGILRNRMYIGEFVFRRTNRELVPSTGETIIKPGAKAEQMTISLPDLRIISDELWAAVQDRLEDNRAESNQPLGSRRRSTYVFSGKFTCGCCGDKMVILGRALGCVGRAHKGTDCPNSVRIPRVDAEAALFAGLRQHLLQPEVITPYLAEYAEAEARLLATRTGEADRVREQLSDVQRQVDNLTAVAAAAQSSPLATERLIAELERLEAQRKKYDKALKAATAMRAPPPTRPEDVIAGMEALLTDLSGALDDDAPEAVRARELVRELIDEIVIVPVPTKTKQRRGSEPVQMIITGAMNDLFKISQTTLGRVSLAGFQTGTRQDHAERRFRFEVTIQRQTPKFAQTAEDSVLIERLLDTAEVPLTKVVLVQALLDGAHPDPEARRAVEMRVRNVMHLLQKAGRVRTVRLGKPVGWVWEHLPLSDEDWRERAGSVEAGALATRTGTVARRDPPSVALH